ncbi:hypothetical protein BB561_003785 [Smittium simulii]|uniref:Uncharacterized protein n=1 Tax=Smittium simulii TaxID=133385 RepID=A0A2T9YJH1_9FUNG|nr:hypothetical protein BB561_003785 [Smittium simulii]
MSINSSNTKESRGLSTSCAKEILLHSLDEISLGVSFPSSPKTVHTIVIKRETFELKSRIEAIKINLLNWGNEYSKSHIHSINTATTIKVQRDNVWQSVPAIMLAKGDVIRLSFGQKAPCLVKLDSETLNKTFYLNQDQIFNFNRYINWMKLKKNEINQLNNFKKDFFCTFTVEETPLDIIKDMLASSKNISQFSVFQNQYDAVLKKYWAIYIVLISIFIISVSVITFTTYKNQDYEYSKILFLYHVSVLTAPIIMLFIMLSLFKRFSVIFGNSSIIVLFNALQQNKSDFEDLADIDEFDADALPPTKDIKVSLSKVFNKMVWLFFNYDHINLSNYNRLLENLASVTTLCSIDKDGTVSHVEPEQLVIPNDSDDKILILDIEKSQTLKYGYSLAIDDSLKQSDNYFNILKPIIDAFTQTSNCKLSNKAKSLDSYYNTNRLSELFWKSSLLESCMYRLGNSIGASSDNNLPRNNEEIFNFTFYSPSHPSRKKNKNIQLSFIPSIQNVIKVPQKLNIKDGNQNFVNIKSFTFGDPELLLSQSDSIWNGKEVINLSDIICSEIYDCYESACVQDLACLAFGFKSFSVSKSSLNKFIEMVNSKSGDCNDLVFSDLKYGHLDLNQSNNGIVILDANNDMNVRDFKDNKNNIHDYAHDDNKKLKYAKSLDSNKLVNNTEIDFLSDKFGDNDLHSLEKYSENAEEIPYYLKLEFKDERLKNVLKRQVLRVNESDADYSFEDFEKLSSDELKNEISDNQIYLGMVTFCNEPKVDVCDVIEDLSLAGIRFVYFSESMGQQSKAFAERLGLETDWNTCILLSSKDNIENEEESFDEIDSPALVQNEFIKEVGGYYEDHEIKARLPRGIEEIKAHLKNVDDIPLQVSLFAECSSKTTSEMIQVFAEYGEIVCVIGSMLGYGNSFPQQSMFLE